MPVLKRVVNGVPEEVYLTMEEFLALEKQRLSVPSEAEVVSAVVTVQPLPLAQMNEISQQETDVVGVPVPSTSTLEEVKSDWRNLQSSNQSTPTMQKPRKTRPSWSRPIKRRTLPTIYEYNGERFRVRAETWYELYKEVFSKLYRENKNHFRHYAQKLRLVAGLRARGRGDSAELVLDDSITLNTHFSSEQGMRAMRRLAEYLGVKFDLLM